MLYGSMKKNAAAQQLAGMRSRSLTKERRREIAQQAANARWDKARQDGTLWSPLRGPVSPSSALADSGTTPVKHGPNRKKKGWTIYYLYL